MADDRPEDIESSPDFARPKRAPPTIDLEATEVIGDADTKVSDEAATDANGEPAAGASGKPAAEASGKPAAEVTGETAEPSAATDAAAEPGAAPSEAPQRAGPGKPWIASILVSAVTGSAAAGLVVAAVWLSGWPGEPASPPTVVPQVDQAAIDTLAARVASIESKAFAEKPSPETAATETAGTESKADTPPGSTPDPAITNRIDALEKSNAALREELSTSRSQSERLTAEVNQLKAAPHEVAAPPDLSAINERLAQIERTSRAQIAETAQQIAKPADDKPLRRVVAATLLDVSVRQGESYTAALDAAKALASDPGVLKPLDMFAATGVPNPGALSRDLLALLPKPAPAPEAAATTGAGIVDRLQAGAARLVRIQRTDAADSSDRTAVIMRAAAAAQRGDIAGARRELNSLPPADRAAVQPGIDRLDARDLALAASRQFAADAMAALSKPAP
jgi:hypothetical protein